ncbi:unnamed protein product [Schistosoma margrebowiei]|uniref:Uncharacterized protein n=1 Tax=Schistosoma margrebowiei TaxID=48269 RepID=A0A183M9T5_9TREM|nr:unnamed protein product [Schistosoma margrebowiei]
MGHYAPAQSGLERYGSQISQLMAVVEMYLLAISWYRNNIEIVPKSTSETTERNRERARSQSTEEGVVTHFYHFYHLARVSW